MNHYGNPSLGDLIRPLDRPLANTRGGAAAIAASARAPAPTLSGSARFLHLPLGWLVAAVAVAVVATGTYAEPASAPAAARDRGVRRPAPELSVVVDGPTISVDGEPLDDWALDADGVVERRGRRWLADGLLMEWTLRIEDQRGDRRGAALALDAPQLAFATSTQILVTANYNIVNTTAITMATGPLVTTVAGCLVAIANGGSAGGVVSDLGGAGATVSTGPGMPMYTALIDNAVVAELLLAPYSISVASWGIGAIGPSSFGVPIPSMPSPPVLTSAAIEINFTLTPNTAVTMVGTFLVQ